MYKSKKAFILEGLSILLSPCYVAALKRLCSLNVQTMHLCILAVPHFLKGEYIYQRSFELNMAQPLLPPSG